MCTTLHGNDRLKQHILQKGRFVRHNPILPYWFDLASELGESERTSNFDSVDLDFHHGKIKLCTISYLLFATRLILTLHRKEKHAFLRFWLMT